MNRGGALFVDHMQYEAYPETETAAPASRRRPAAPICVVPFVFLFVGYDGQYYLCCSDWKKEAPLGSVFDTSFVDLTAAKLDHVLGREPVCKTCNLDPVNRVTEELAGARRRPRRPGDGRCPHRPGRQRGRQRRSASSVCSTPRSTSRRGPRSGPARGA